MTRWDPGFHAENDYPILYDVFLIVLMVFCILLMIGFFYNTFRFYKAGNKVLLRHKVFYFLSLYFILAFFLISLTGFYQSYDASGARLLMVVFLGNFYVLMLQVLWRFAPQGYREYLEIVERIKMGQKNEQDRKEELGLNYFDDVKVNISKKTSSQNSSQITLNAHNESIQLQEKTTIQDI